MNALRKIEDAIIGTLIVEPMFVKKLPSFFNAELLEDAVNKKIFNWVVSKVYESDMTETDFADLLDKVAVAPGHINKLQDACWQDLMFLNFDERMEYWLKQSNILAVTRRIEQDMAEGKITYVESMEKMRIAIEEFEKGESVDKELPSDKQICEALIKELEQGQDTSRIITGTPLDRMYQFRKTEMTVIGASTSIGKSLFALFLAHQFNSKANMSGIYVSTEMAERDQAARSISHRSSIQSNKIRDFDLTSEDMEKLKYYLKESSNNLRWDCISYKVNDIEKRVMNIRPDFLIIDHLQDLNLSYKKSRDEAVGENVRRLKRLALTYNFALVIMSQLSREADKSTKKEIWMLRDSGSIEQVADGILFLERDREVDFRTTKLTVKKNRHGVCGTENIMQCNLPTGDFYPE